jgi:hypothetical protein
MSYIPETLRRQIDQRANGRCEYCLIHDDDVYMPHEIDHIIAEKHGGETHESNLCLSCYECNRHKGSDLTSIDPVTHEIVALFHPRKDTWNEHFRLDGAVIVPLTAKGRVTARLLQFNKQERLLEREVLISAGHYP